MPRRNKPAPLPAGLPTAGHEEVNQRVYISGLEGTHDVRTGIAYYYRGHYLYGPKLNPIEPHQFPSKGRLLLSGTTADSAPKHDFGNPRLISEADNNAFLWAQMTHYFLNNRLDLPNRLPLPLQASRHHSLHPITHSTMHGALPIEGPVTSKHKKPLSQPNRVGQPQSGFAFVSPPALHTYVLTPSPHGSLALQDENSVGQGRDAEFGGKLSGNHGKRLEPRKFATPHDRSHFLAASAPGTRYQSAANSTTPSRLGSPTTAQYIQGSVHPSLSEQRLSDILSKYHAGISEGTHHSKLIEESGRRSASDTFPSRTQSPFAPHIRRTPVDNSMSTIQAYGSFPRSSDVLSRPQSRKSSRFLPIQEESTSDEDRIQGGPSMFKAHARMSGLRRSASGTSMSRASQHHPNAIGQEYESYKAEARRRSLHERVDRQQTPSPYGLDGPILYPNEVDGAHFYGHNPRDHPSLRHIGSLGPRKTSLAELQTSPSTPDLRLMSDIRTDTIGHRSGIPRPHPIKSKRADLPMMNVRASLHDPVHANIGRPRNASLSLNEAYNQTRLDTFSIDSDADSLHLVSRPSSRPDSGVISGGHVDLKGHGNILSSGQNAASSQNISQLGIPNGNTDSGYYYSINDSNRVSHRGTDNHVGTSPRSSGVARGLLKCSIHDNCDGTYVGWPHQTEFVRSFGGGFVEDVPMIQTRGREMVDWALLLEEERERIETAGDLRLNRQ